MVKGLVKSVKKAFKYARRSLRKRYVKRNGKKSSLNLGRIASDVMMLKNMVNAEKKKFSMFSSDNSILLGQVNINQSAHICQDITPIPSQGANGSQRNGNSIKVHSAMLKAQIQQESGASSPITGRVYIIAVDGSPVTTAVAPGEFFEPNAWLGAQNPGTVIYDTHCQRNQDFFKDYKVIASKSFYIKNDNISGQTMIKDVNIPLRFKSHHVKFNNDTQNVASGQLLALWVVDSGNVSAGTTSTLLGISQTNILTGLFLRYDYQFYYYDN